MSRPFTSKLYNVTDSDFIEIVKSSKTYADVLRACSIEYKGANINTVKRRIQNMGLNTDHIPKGWGTNKGREFKHHQISLEETNTKHLVENSKTRRATVKMLVQKYKLVPYQCECGNSGEWREKTISLQLEHKNGIPDDNRIENLCFMCPNCHSQTSTFAGKKTKKLYKEYDTKEFRNDCETLQLKFICKKYNLSYDKILDIRKMLGIKAKNIRPDTRKFDIPKEELILLVETTPLQTIGKTYNVTGNTVKKRCKVLGINIKPRGYWSFFRKR